MIAYEPVWAIGTGEVATPEDAQEVCGAIRGRLAELYAQELADDGPHPVRRLGQVRATSPAIMAQPDVDGALVGGAALDAEEFVKIVRFRDQCSRLTGADPTYPGGAGRRSLRRSGPVAVVT